MSHSKPSILIRCDGSTEIGLGHVVRCLALADEFSRAHDCTVTFAMRRDALGVRLCDERGYRVVRGLTPNLPDDGVWLRNLSQDLQAEILILDVRDELPRQVIQRLKDEGLYIVTIDDPTDRRLDADLAFYPPIPQLRQLDWLGFIGKRYAGWEWVITRPEFSAPTTRETSSHRPVILVTMGGSDPAGMTAKAVEGLNGVEGDCEMVIVLGPGFQDDQALNVQLECATHPYTVERHSTKMWEVMNHVDFSLASFGGTAYELAVMQVPSVLIGLTQDHVKSASAFVNAGIAMCLGQHEQVTPQMITQATTQLLNDPGRLHQMRMRAKHIMKGGGSQRIADTILKEWQNHHDSCYEMASAHR